MFSGQQDTLCIVYFITCRILIPTGSVCLPGLPGITAPGKPVQTSHRFTIGHLGLKPLLVMYFNEINVPETAGNYCNQQSLFGAITPNYPLLRLSPSAFLSKHLIEIRINLGDYISLKTSIQNLKKL